MSTEKWLWPYPGTGPANLSRGWQSNHKGIDIVKAGNPHHYVIATKSGRVERAYRGCVNHSGANPADYRPCAARWLPRRQPARGLPLLQLRLRKRRDTPPRRAGVFTLCAF